MYIGKICGIRLILNGWFLAVVLLFALLGPVKEVLAVFACVLVHEYAHALMAAALGCSVREIELLPFGGVARIDRLQDCGRKNCALIACAGPCCSLAIAFLCLAAESVRPFELAALLAQVNFMLGLFNLLPAFPLDGGRIFHAFFQGFVSHKRATAFVTYLSYCLCAAILCKTAYDFILFHTVNFSLGIIALFIFVSSRKEARQMDFHFVRVMTFKKTDTIKKGYMAAKQYVALEQTAVMDVARQFKPDQYAVVFIVDDGHRVRKVMTEVELWDALAETGAAVRFCDLL